MLWKWSLYLYKKLCLWTLWRRVVKSREHKNMQNLIFLHPGADGMQLLTDYYVEKIRLMLLILIMGSGFSACTWLSGVSVQKEVFENQIKRPQESAQIILEAHIKGAEEEFKEEVVIEVRETMLEPREADAAFEELIDVLSERIWGQNASSQEISLDLELPEYVEGYPFCLVWESSNDKILDSDGQVYAETLETAEEISLTVETFYDDQIRSHCWQLKILPLDRTFRQQLIHDLRKEMIYAEDVQKYEEEVSLPVDIKDHRISWKIKGKSTGRNVLILTIMTAVITYGLKDKDLQDEVLQRRKKMKREYPLIVSKYALFLEAGMTVRGAFIKINKDYQKKEISSKNPVYEEMNFACNEMMAGISEYKVYEHFARRIGLPEYTRLCALLSQNLKKGNTALASRLREESEKALIEDIQERKRQGEEAGTKLLLPMGMMLIFVLVLVMLPAFSSLG